MKKIFYVVILALLLQSCGYSVKQTIEKRWADEDTYLYTEIMLNGDPVKTWCDEVITDSIKQVRYNQANHQVDVFNQVNDYKPTEEVIQEVLEENKYIFAY